MMLWAIFCWGTLGPVIHVDVTLTCTANQSLVADHVHPFTEIVIPDGYGLFEQDNHRCHKAKMFQEWFEELSVSNVLVQGVCVCVCARINCNRFSSLLRSA